jgi:outer membrane protein insertion porin family
MTCRVGLTSLQPQRRAASGFVWLVWLVAFFGLLTWNTAFAAEPAPAEGNVVKVSVSGARRIEEAVVLAAIGLRRGEALSVEKVRRDIKAIYATGFFEDVRVDVLPDPDGGGVQVRFIVDEKPAVRDVNLEGNKKIDDDDIREVLDVRAFAVLNEAKIAEAVREIRELYVEKGFYLADIEVQYTEVTDDQVDVTFAIEENRKVVIQRVDLSGNFHLADSKIKRFLQLKEGGFVPWLTSTGNFRSELLDVDQQTIQAVYLEEGYLDVDVDPAKVYLSPDKRYIFISYDLEEGEQYSIGEVGVEGDFEPELGLTREAVMEIIAGRQVADVQEDLWRDAEQRSDRLVDLEAKGPALVPGEVFRWSTVNNVRAAIESFYQDQGYAFVNVVPMPDPDPETLQANVTFAVEKGEKYRVGRINITGNNPTFDKIVRREVQINEGDVYRGSLVNASKMRLQRLGFFEEVNVATPRGDAPDELDLNLQVTEQPTGSFSLGMGYSNLESFVLTANVQKNNFLGLGYVMSAAINWSALRRQGNLSFFDPYFLDSRWSANISLYSTQQQFILDQYQRGGSLSLGRYLDPRDDVQLQFTYSFEDVGLNNITPFQRYVLGGDLYRNGLTSSMGIGITADKRNNRIFPTKGVLASARTTLSGGFRIDDDTVLSVFGGDFNMLETNLNIRVYQPLIPNSDKMVLRINSTVGDIRSTDGRVIPFIHRYRAGGINSVRGYNWYSLGPSIRTLSSDDPVRADDKNIVGGEQTWVNNFEIENPIIRAAGISGVIFFDAGNAFTGPFGENPINPLDLRFAYGGGVRWRSPIGPLRFELGIPVKPQPGERPRVFDFSIGSFF